MTPEALSALGRVVNRTPRPEPVTVRAWLLVAGSLLMVAFPPLALIAAPVAVAGLAVGTVNDWRRDRHDSQTASALCRTEER